LSTDPRPFVRFSSLRVRHRFPKSFLGSHPFEPLDTIRHRDRWRRQPSWGELVLVLSRCTSLETLLLDDLVVPDGAPLAPLVGASSATLQVLRLGTRHPSSVSPESVQDVVTACPRLRALDVRHLIAPGHWTPRSQSLTVVVGSEAVKGSTLTEWAVHCPALQVGCAARDTRVPACVPACLRACVLRKALTPSPHLASFPLIVTLVPGDARARHYRRLG